MFINHNSNNLFQSLSAAKKGSPIQDLVHIQIILGITTTLGVILAAISVRRQLVFRNIIFSTTIICQVSFYLIILQFLHIFVV